MSPAACSISGTSDFPSAPGSGGRPEQIEQRRPDVGVRDALLDHDARLELEREHDHEGNLGHLAVQVPRVALEAVLAKGLAVVRGEHDQRALEQAPLAEIASTSAPIRRSIQRIDWS